MRPKWLLTHPNGMLMIEHVLRSTGIEQFDRIIIVCLQSHEEKFKVSTIMAQLSTSLGVRIEICLLPAETLGPADTVAQAIVRSEVQGSIVVRDSDNLVSFSAMRGNFVIGISLNDIDVTNVRGKSYILLDHDGSSIADIIEKRICSNLICLGVYGFALASDFLQGYRLLAASNSDGITGGEIYVSHIVSYLISVKQQGFSYAAAKRFEDWGTLQDWNKARHAARTIFVDLDGVCLRNVGRYGERNWDNFLEPLIDNLNRLRELQNSGAQIVLTTSRPESYREEVLAKLAEFGVVPFAAVFGCHHAQRVLVNDYAPSNPYPSCVAISVPRDSNLSDFL